MKVLKISGYISILTVLIATNFVPDKQQCLYIFFAIFGFGAFVTAIMANILESRHTGKPRFSEEINLSFVGDNADDFQTRRKIATLNSMGIGCLVAVLFLYINNSIGFESSYWFVIGEGWLIGVTFYAFSYYVIYRFLLRR